LPPLPPEPPLPSDWGLQEASISLVGIPEQTDAQHLAQTLTNSIESSEDNVRVRLMKLHLSHEREVASNTSFALMALEEGVDSQVCTGTTDQSQCAVGARWAGPSAPSRLRRAQQRLGADAQFVAVVTVEHVVDSGLLEPFPLNVSRLSASVGLDKISVGVAKEVALQAEVVVAQPSSSLPLVDVVSSITADVASEFQLSADALQIGIEAPPPSPSLSQAPASAELTSPITVTVVALLVLALSCVGCIAWRLYRHNVQLAAMICKRETTPHRSLSTPQHQSQPPPPSCGSPLPVPPSTLSQCSATVQYSSGRGGELVIRLTPQTTYSPGGSAPSVLVQRC